MEVTKIMKQSKHILLFTLIVLFSLSVLITGNVFAAPMQQNSSLNSLQETLTSIVEKISPSVVSITGETDKPAASKQRSSVPDNDIFKNFPFPFPFPDDEGDSRSIPSESMGTGVIVRQDGYILTNDHVVGSADKVTVTLKDGRTFDGKVSRDPKGDLALIKIEAKGLTEAKLGDSDKIKAGSIVIAIGSPFGYDQTVTAGVISGIGRQAGVSVGNESRYYPNLLQTDASINPGNSGGPLINIDGEVIGINTLIRSNYAGGNIGIGFAIPSNTAKFVMNQLIATGKVTRGYLGIQPDDLSPEQRDTYGVEYGALVRTVEKDSPADKAGIQVEDIIIEINGNKIENQLKLRDAIAAVKPGTEIPITVVRNKERIVLKVTLKADPLSTSNNDSNNKESINKLGFSASNITSDVIDRYKLEPDVSGVVVTSVTARSNAAKAGVKAGMVIIRANNKTVNNIDDFNAVVKNMKSGDVLRLVIKTKERTILLNYKLD